MNYEGDTTWLTYSCQVIHTCSAFIQTITKKISTEVHRIRFMKRDTLVIFDIMLVWILFHCRLRGSPLATKSRPSWNTATQAFWNTASKSWLFLGNLSSIIFCHMTWTSISMLFFHFQGSQVLFTDTNVNRIFWCALTCYTNPQINKQSQ